MPKSVTKQVKHREHATVYALQRVAGNGVRYFGSTGGASGPVRFPHAYFYSERGDAVAMRDDIRSDLDKVYVVVPCRVIPLSSAKKNKKRTR